MKKYFLALIATFSIFNSYSQNSGNDLVTINAPGPICQPGFCTDLQANYPELKQATTYSVAPIAYNPNFPFSWDGNSSHKMDTSSDDKWSSVVNLPFDFCFYGTTYSQLLIGSNGLLTFDLSGQLSGGNCPWAFNTTVPSATFPVRNAIYGVYQDTNLMVPPVLNPVVQNVNYYILDSGIYAAPNRVFVVNFNELPQYQCNNGVGLQTSQIVLYETTNTVDINVMKRTSCSWNSGSGLIGLQNQAGTLAAVPLGRNTGNWSATNEAWRFTPNGASSTSFSWFKDGIFFSSANPISVCPTTSETYTAVATYAQCNGNSVVFNKSITVAVAAAIPVANPINLSACTDSGSLGFFDLTINTPLVLNGLNPNDYLVAYFTSLSDATNYANPITVLSSYASFGETLYMRIESFATGCIVIKSFNLNVVAAPVAPTGNAVQSFISGETLANIEISGTNVRWYSEAVNGVLLPVTTVLADGVTYYASQTNASGCESRNTPNRFGITVYNVLSNSGWDLSNLKISPNPVTNMLSLSYVQNITNITVFNLLGQEVIVKNLNANQAQIDMSNLANGTYLVKVTAGNQVKTIKVLKQ